VRCSQKLQQINKTFIFGSRSFKVIDVDKREKLVTGACCDKQQPATIFFALNEQTVVK